MTKVGGTWPNGTGFALKVWRHQSVSADCRANVDAYYDIQQPRHECRISHTNTALSEPQLRWFWGFAAQHI
jgi:hypothetical protein